MKPFFYACIFDAGDILYETGNEEHRAICAMVAQHATTSHPKRALLHHNFTRYRSPERELHFETCLAQLMQEYNIDLDKEPELLTSKIKKELQAAPKIQKETVEGLLSPEDLVIVEREQPSESVILDFDHEPENQNRTFKRKISYVVILIFILLFVGMASASIVCVFSTGHCGLSPKPTKPASTESNFFIESNLLEET